MCAAAPALIVREVTPLSEPDHLAGQRAAGEYLRQLLLQPGAYRDSWRQHVDRPRDGVVNQLAVAEVPASTTCAPASTRAGRPDRAARAAEHCRACAGRTAAQPPVAAAVHRRLRPDRRRGRPGLAAVERRHHDPRARGPWRGARAGRAGHQRRSRAAPSPGAGHARPREGRRDRADREPARHPDDRGHRRFGRQHPGPGRHHRPDPGGRPGLPGTSPARPGRSRAGCFSPGSGRPDAAAGRDGCARILGVMARRQPRQPVRPGIPARRHREDRGL